jgi:hypothetical protein
MRISVARIAPRRWVSSRTPPPPPSLIFLSSSALFFSLQLPCSCIHYGYILSLAHLFLLISACINSLPPRRRRIRTSLGLEGSRHRQLRRLLFPFDFFVLGGRGRGDDTMKLRKAARLILVGAPGVGKGTQAERLLQRFPQLSAISSGGLLRDNVKNQTPLGMPILFLNQVSANSSFPSRHQSSKHNEIRRPRPRCHDPASHPP